MNSDNSTYEMYIEISSMDWIPVDIEAELIILGLIAQNTISRIPKRISQGDEPWLFTC